MIEIERYLNKDYTIDIVLRDYVNGVRCMEKKPDK
jgi:hypothetical protein